MRDAGVTPATVTIEYRGLGVVSLPPAALPRAAHPLRCLLLASGCALAHSFLLVLTCRMLTARDPPRGGGSKRLGKLPCNGNLQLSSLVTGQCKVEQFQFGQTSLPCCACSYSVPSIRPRFPCFLAPCVAGGGCPGWRGQHPNPGQRFHGPAEEGNAAGRAGRGQERLLWRCSRQGRAVPLQPGAGARTLPVWSTLLAVASWDMRSSPCQAVQSSWRQPRARAPQTPRACLQGGLKRQPYGILKDLSGVLRPGTITLLLGPPGAGKTVFLQVWGL